MSPVLITAEYLITKLQRSGCRTEKYAKSLRFIIFIIMIPATLMDNGLKCVIEF